MSNVSGARRFLWPALFVVQSLVLLAVWVRMSALEIHLAVAVGDATVLSEVARNRSLSAEDATDSLRAHYPAGTKQAESSATGRMVEIVRELAIEVVECRGGERAN